jgi:endogenous inhibitor of DNA gyrase (YacG/DUF329 family)
MEVTRSRTFKDQFMKIKCPKCGIDTIYSKENTNRPFCSKRCKNDDVIAWANGDNKISSPITEKDSLSDEEINSIIRAKSGEEY